jgi:hypothetical protein
MTCIATVAFYTAALVFGTGIHRAAFSNAGDVDITITAISFWHFSTTFAAVAFSATTGSISLAYTSEFIPFHVAAHLAV